MFAEKFKNNKKPLRSKNSHIYRAQMTKNFLLTTLKKLFSYQMIF